jgi:hypothetical protein
MSERRSKDINFTALLLVKALEEKKFPVYAAGLQWDTYLSLAWTEWRAPAASFVWNRHRHPRPDQLLRQVQEWTACVEELRKERFDADRHAFSWVYYQKRWSATRWFEKGDYVFGIDEEAVDDCLPELNWADFEGMSDSDRWSVVEDLDRDDYPDLNDAEFDAEKAEWKDRTLPLLARPEIGFPVETQKALLKNRDEERDASLKTLRRRFVTNAIVASKVQRGEARDLPKDEDVKEAIRIIDDEYQSRHGGKNLWKEVEGAD